MTKLEAYGYSIASEKHPFRNEDSYFTASNGAIGVFDGLGGHPGSQAASQLAARLCHEYLDNQAAALPPEHAAQLFFDVLSEANAAIKREQELGKRGIATTAIIAQVFSDLAGNPYAQFGYSGDSRGYVLHNQIFSYVSLDHAASTKNMPAAERRRIQRHLGSVYRRDQIDPYDWNHLYERNVIAHCLDGLAGPYITLDTVPINIGDSLLLTSDGIHDNLTLKEIRRTLSYAGLDAPELLVQQALQRSREAKKGQLSIDGELFEIDYIRPKSDDMTAVVGMLRGN